MLNLMRICSFILAINFTFPLLADTEFQDNVPIGFAEGLLSGPDFGQPTFYSDIIESFPNFDVPQQFELLGSADLVYVTRVILRSTLNLKEARKLLADNLRTTGFEVAATINDIPESAGFISLDLPVLPLTFCHDNFGSVSASFREASLASIIVLEHSLAGASPDQNCTDYIEQRSEEVAFIASRRNSGLKSYQPRLVMPQPPSDNKMSYGSGIQGTGSDDYYISTTGLATDWSISEIYKHFADQISAQNWKQRSESIGLTASVGEWLSPADADLTLLGTFTVQKIDDSKYKLEFRTDRILYIPNLNTGPNGPFRIPSH